MYTVVETPIYSRLAQDILSQDEQEELAVYLATNPQAGDVIPHSSGCRKVRWKRSGAGKSGGVRTIYFNKLEEGEIHLLLIYAKAKHENIPTHILKQLREELEK
ncbi:transcriptional regulator [Pasteurellaceae bacterium RH1A]|nr:transcriptional regulator [Pasteurellaceae bacterium RH1A]